MRINSSPGFVWRKLNESVQKQLGCESKVFVYPNTKSALLDICLSLHMRLSHKKKIVSITGLGDHVKSTEFELSRLGVRFKKDFEDDLAQEEKQVLSLIHDLDDAVTAELYDHIEILKKLTSSKIFKIHLAHHLFRFNKNFIQKLSDLDVIIATLNENYTLVFLGEKSVISPLMVENLNWDFDQDFKNISLELNKIDLSFQEAITEFESHLPDGLTSWFSEKPVSHRLFDRAVIVVKDHDGSAFIELLAENLNIPIRGPA